MIDVREAAWEFVSTRYGLLRAAFDVAWRFEPEPREPGRRPSTSKRLGIADDEDSGGIVAVLIFSLASKNVGSNPEIGRLIAALKAAATGFPISPKHIEELLGFVRKVAERDNAAITTSAVRPTLEKNSAARPYARRWTNGTPKGGEEISKDEFDKEYAQRKEGSYLIFIYDGGAFLADRIGEVYIDKRLIGAPILEPIPYRILVHALRNGGNAGTYLDVGAACWLDGETLRRLKADIEKGTKYAFSKPMRTIGKSIGSVSTLLQGTIGATLTSKKNTDKAIRMSFVPPYCVLELLSDRSE